MNDGSLHNMTFRSSSHSRSIFADLVDYKAGGVVSSRCDSLPYLKTPEFALIRTHQISESIREGQIITCGAHLSHFGVVFGLNQGDIVYVRAASDGLYVETLLRSEWVLTSLLSGFLGSNRKAGILAVSGSFLLASASPLPPSLISLGRCPPQRLFHLGLCQRRRSLAGVGLPLPLLSSRDLCHVTHRPGDR
jgi:hypothetical protein